ncbi:Hypothetical Protein FCC1311_042252 [Hondaea fermentalgiana]|uniref:Uncharacterized protein n=1 Tax=Hondaea fermentalgiana TaxID=2315210 RepID=A0A2R5GAH1_9STRA|nr:Hypothetical Protein FCC1311_042252 [Hondaea fermentalgiana]|eukprot:GBG28002.1 Hypothetical Protein FCC1311_042252 [Hondaea fermentalgiana]
MAAVVQCPGCSKIVGHSVAEEAASSSSLLQVQVCRGLELSAQLYDDPRRREEGPCRKAQCAACKTPLGKVLVDSDVLVVSRGDVHVYEIPRIASSLEDEHGRPSRTARSLKRKRTTASAPTSPTLPTGGLKHALAPEMPGRADIRDLVRREVANARARWAADLATEKSMESLVKELGIVVDATLTAKWMKKNKKNKNQRHIVNHH